MDLAQRIERGLLELGKQLLEITVADEIASDPEIKQERERLALQLAALERLVEVRDRPEPTIQAGPDS